MLYMLSYLNFYQHHCTSYINLPPKLHQHCSTVASRMWYCTRLERLSFTLHHFPCSSSQRVPDISLLLQTGVSQPDLHTAPTTQTPSGTTMPHTSSIFHSPMKYAWICARHLPSLGLCSPQEACLICNWEVCWINQQFIRFLIEITLSKNTDNTAPLILLILSFAHCQFSSVYSRMARWDSREITVLGIRKKANKDRNIFTVQTKQRSMEISSDVSIFFPLLCCLVGRLLIFHPNALQLNSNSQIIVDYIIHKA